MKRVSHDLSAQQWEALLDQWGGCAYCGDASGPLQRDCVLPISRGGRYTLSNIVPACQACNASKCNSEVTEWMRRKRLDEPAFLLRHAQVQQAVAPLFEDTAGTGPGRIALAAESSAESSAEPTRTRAEA